MEEKVEEPVEEEEEDPEALMRQMMGFSGFETTTGKHVIGNAEKGAVDIKSSSNLSLIKPVCSVLSRLNRAS